MAQYRVKNGHHIIGGKNLRVGNVFEVKNPAFLKSEDFDRFFERVLPIDVSPKVNPDAVQNEVSVNDGNKEQKVSKVGRPKKTDVATEVQ
jgi:hypothetical protein